MKKLRTLFVVLLMLCALTGFFIYSIYTSVVTQPKGVVYYLQPGTSKKVLIQQLSEQKIIQSPWLFSLYLYAHPYAHLKFGEYLFRPGSSMKSILKQITTGTGLFNRSFIIVPGTTSTQLRQALARAEGLRHLTAPLSEQQIMSALGATQATLEGEFFPETYYYSRGISDLVILKRAYDLMQLRLNEAWNNRAANLPYQTPYEALIAASLIEKEAYLDSERPVISGVLVNRLRANMLLQIDPTVIYGMGERYHGKIFKENLLEDTVYNTYVHKGLPPTPIAMPSLVSIEAAMHPMQHDYLYFVARGDGSHQFSKTLDAHHEAVTAAKDPHLSISNDGPVKHYLPALLPSVTQPVAGGSVRQ